MTEDGFEPWPSRYGDGLGPMPPGPSEARRRLVQDMYADLTVDNREVMTRFDPLEYGTEGILVMCGNSCDSRHGVETLEPEYALELRQQMAEELDLPATLELARRFRWIDSVQYADSDDDSTEAVGVLCRLPLSGRDNPVLALLQYGTDVHDTMTLFGARLLSEGRQEEYRLEMVHDALRLALAALPVYDGGSDEMLPDISRLSLGEAQAMLRDLWHIRRGLHVAPRTYPGGLIADRRRLARSVLPTVLPGVGIAAGRAARIEHARRLYCAKLQSLQDDEHVSPDVRTAVSGDEWCKWTAELDRQLDRRIQSVYAARLGGLAAVACGLEAAVVSVGAPNKTLACAGLASLAIASYTLRLRRRVRTAWSRMEEYAVREEPLGGQSVVPGLAALIALAGDLRQLL